MSARRWLQRPHNIPWRLVAFLVWAAMIIAVMVSAGIEYEEQRKADQALTPEERQERQEQQARSNEERGARLARENARAKSLCRLRSSCALYPAARQECAVAANFANCMDIKVGVGWGSCMNDGHLRNPPSDMPGWLACLWWDYVD